MKGTYKIGIAVLAIAVLAIVLVVPVAYAPRGGNGGGGPRECNDGIDNDGDGFTDYPDDRGCSGKGDRSELNSNIECDDGIDNDGDTFTDYPDDPGCASVTDDNELSYFHCDNGVDDDGDSLTDYPDDPECLNATDSLEADNSCSDTDGGQIYDVQGTASGFFSDNPYSLTDYCNNANTTQTVIEHYCDGSSRRTESFNCIAGGWSGCVDGACV